MRFMRCAVSEPAMTDKIALSVIVTTLNEEKNLPRCLAALDAFDEVIIADSNSEDATGSVARSFGASVVNFSWNGAYPKKRQWCLDNLPLKHDRIFFVDADEEVTGGLLSEIAALDWNCAGYFVKGVYTLNAKPLRRGIVNNKLCLFDRRLVHFPVVDDLEISGMGEMEGHYQPVLKDGVCATVGQLKNPLYHHAMEDAGKYVERHERYAAWEAGMRLYKAYPAENAMGRKILKRIFGSMPFRPVAAFLHSYILKGGFLDGKGGLHLSAARYKYYARVRYAEKQRRAGK
ncbi:MAG: glycosyltransferase family 2 protein [Micavibrio aeruginosavorus]|uniref:Glycosyltransferase family 2 protein n=1 Tax=Micavibrio aeruginosavorus TaxID=349221 RepID=A0A2W4ZW13_9BACT|nr:MAG: glycosyltransferase family 2 protein [Micavibrio aeruginosavorus]